MQELQLPSSATGSVLLSEQQDKLLACIHCGLCLEACPTYLHTGDENDSPRGRIYLMRAVEEKRLSAQSETFENHINRCLGCRACEQACPAGVEYGQLLEAARSDIHTTEKQNSFSDQLLRFILRHIWLQPRRLRLAFIAARLFRDSQLPGLLLKMRLPQLISARLAFPLAMLASSSPANIEQSSDEDAQSIQGKVDSKTLLFTGCVTEGLFRRVNRATSRVLRVNGCETSAPRGQVCCGALHAHAGDIEGARHLARRNVDAFECTDATIPIITNAGGCGAMLLSYTHVLEGDAIYAERARRFSARVRDVSQQLETIGIRSANSPAVNCAKTTYDASCHLLYGQRAVTAPVDMIKTALGTAEDFKPLQDSDVCCGGAGIYNLLQPELSQKILDEKLKNISDTQAQILATGNPGCHMHIGAGAHLAGMKNLHICHPIELLDLSYKKAGFYREEQT